MRPSVFDVDDRYHEYDFHAETRGMKYENISKLVSAMERTFEAQGSVHFTRLESRWLDRSTVIYGYPMDSSSRSKGLYTA